MVTVEERVEQLLVFAPPGEADNYCRKELKKGLLSYQKSVRPKDFLSELEFTVNGWGYQSLYDAIFEEEEVGDFEMRFLSPRKDALWEYEVPTQKLKVNPQGKGGLVVYPIDPTKLEKWDRSMEPVIEPAMFRAYVSRFFSPESIKTKSKKVTEDPVIVPPPLCPISEMWAELRKKGAIPFEVVVCAYGKTRRFTYILDLVHNRQLADFRDGKIPVANRMQRTPLQYFALDRILSLHDMPLMPKRVLQVLFEVSETSASDIAVGLGITDKMAEQNMAALVNRGYVDRLGKPPNQTFEINLENITKAGPGSQ